MVLQGSSKSHDASSLPVPEIYHFLPYAVICPVKIVKKRETEGEIRKKEEEIIVAKSHHFLTRKVMMEFLECVVGIFFFQKLVFKLISAIISR